LFVFLSLTVAENLPITVVFIGLYGFWRFRTRIINALKTRKIADITFFVPILTIVMSVAWLFFAGWIRQVNWVVNPAFMQLYKAVDHWSVLGITDDPNKLPIYVITQPSRAVAALAYDLPLKLLYLVLLLGPLLFLSLGSSITFISLAWLVPALLSNYTPYYTIGDHFPAYPVAFIFLGAVEGLRKISLSGDRPSLAKLVRRTKALLVVSLVFTLTISPLSPVMTIAGNNFPQFSDYHPPIVTPHDMLLQSISDMVPSNASVLTQNSIFVHFSSRANAYVYPLPFMQGYNDTELHTYVEGLFQKSQYVMTDASTDNYTASLILLRITTVGDYGLVANTTTVDGICLYEKNYFGPIVSFGA
jgi:uncharacterized membrane protein